MVVIGSRGGGGKKVWIGWWWRSLEVLSKVFNPPGKAGIFSSDDVTIFGLYVSDLFVRATTGITKEVVDQSLIVAMGGIF